MIILSKEYDFVVDVDKKGNVKLPKKIKEAKGSKTVRQPSSTTVYRKNCMQFYSSENSHLQTTMEYFEAEIKVWDQDKKYLIKAEFPKDMSDELQAKIQTHINSNGDTE